MTSWLPGETFAQYRERSHRRQRMVERFGMPAVAVLAILVAWVAVGVALGSP